jgi:predicted AAA+ superfamily ATPase
VQALRSGQGVAELQRLLQVLAARIGSRVDNTKLASIVGLSRPTLLQYLEFLEKTYVIYRLPAYSGSPDRVTALSKKLYFYDNGIATTLAKVSDGALFENAVFNQLRAYGDLAYLTKGSQHEVDFILTRGAERVALETKLSPLAADLTRAKRIGSQAGLPEAHLIGRYPSPGMEEFVWGGLLF